MNILYISRTMGQGGAEKIVYQLSVDAARRGAGVFVASCGGVYVDLMEKHHIRHILIRDLESKNPFILLRTVQILSEVVKKEHIDIIHAHHRMAQFYAAVLKFLFPEIRLIYTAHNVFFDKARFMRMILGKTTIVSVGSSVKDNLIQIFGVEPKRIQVIYNGVEAEKPDKKYQDHELTVLKEQGFYLIGIIGRLSCQKGIDIFIGTVQCLKQQGLPVKGVIIGDGEEKDNIRNMIKEKKLADDLVLMGYQSHIPALISQMDLVVMPSRWEGFPLLPFEVFAAHKTIVASNIGGINEIVKNMENGILVEKDNEKAFAEAVVTLLKDEVLRTELENNGVKTFNTYNNYNDFVDQYYILYEKLMKEQE